MTNERAAWICERLLRRLTGRWYRVTPIEAPQPADLDALYTDEGGEG